MKFFLNSFLLSLFFLLHSTTCFSQSTNKIDSLESELKKSVDTSKVNVLNALAQEYLKKSPETALDYSNQALTLSKKIDFKKGAGNAYAKMGAVYSVKGNFGKALELYSKSLAIREGIDDKKGIANSLNNIGNVNLNQ